jgi:hypothetical protein
MNAESGGPGFPDVSEQVRRILRESGFPLPGDDDPHMSIPTRVWLSPTSVAYGYLEAHMGEGVDDAWDVWFRMAPLQERPRYELTLGPATDAEVAE